MESTGSLGTFHNILSSYIRVTRIKRYCSLMRKKKKEKKASVMLAYGVWECVKAMLGLFVSKEVKPVLCDSGKFTYSPT
ncbi:hypothetical protein CEXT_339021 [Caerostris extrusa]|uniref:Uncharacterized protein n=1 Tax=Caerostris extrusa TaxID=172846 RepID=A0AAV4NL75_CAEEX|nr:hypothetical protein CEXT_339021 [Caerostris extrusa]